MKKVLTFILAVSLIVSSFALPAFAASNSFTVNAPGKADSPGQELSVNVSVVASDGFAGLQFMLEYDSSMLKCTGIEIGDNLKDKITATNPDLPSAAFVLVVDVDTIGIYADVATIKFTALKAGALSFNLTDAMICDVDGNELSFDVFGGASYSERPSKSENVINIDSDASSDTSESDSTAVKAETVDEDKKTTTQTTGSAASYEFTDMKGHWSEEFVSRAVEKGIFKGYSDGSFRPDSPVSRIQFVTVLYRMAGSPAVTYEAPFTDVKNLSDEFKAAAAWAYFNGYVNGKGTGTFDPSGSITRQEAMKILFNVSGAAAGAEQLFSSIYGESFADSGDIASWAKQPMYWAYYNGLISGTSGGKLSPKGTASRGQIAKILINYLDKAL